MASTIRKCISLSPTIPAPDGSPLDKQDYRLCFNEVLETGTRWIKLWARWDLIHQQQIPAYDLGNPAINTAGYKYIAALDAQIALARSHGLGVIIQSYCFPLWVNQTHWLIHDHPVEWAAYKEERYTKNQWLIAQAATQQADRVRLHGVRKPLHFRIPPDAELQTNGQWAGWVLFLMERYRHHGTSIVIDLINEPNLQWWPQQNPSDTSDAWGSGQGGPPACAAARMMATAQTISSWLGHPVLLAAPGTSDLRGPGTGYHRLHTSYTSFITGLLATLQSINFTAHSRFIWSHHNYIDILENLGQGGAGGPNRAAQVRGMLMSAGWAGWRGSRTDIPNIWLTEGGCKLNGGSQAQQDNLIRASFARMQGAQGDGAGMEMMTNYLLYSLETYDTGLRNAETLGGAARASYWGWQSLPGRF